MPAMPRDRQATNHCQRRLSIVWLALTLLSFSLPIWSHSARADEAQAPRKIKTIIVDHYYPYTFVNGPGEIDGFSVDLMKAVASQMGMEVEIRVDTWANAQSALASGEIDFLPMMAFSEERDKTFDFSPPHTIAFDAVFARKDLPSIHSLHDLKGRKVIVMKNDRAHEFLKGLDYIESEQLIFSNDLADTLRMLESGQGDVALMPKLVGLAMIDKLGLHHLEMEPMLVEEYQRPFSLVVRHGNQELLERLNQGVSILKETKKYNAIYTKWFGQYELPGGMAARTLRYILWGIAGLSFGGLILLLWNLALRRQVGRRTKELLLQIEERQRVESKLLESNILLKAVLDGATDAIFVKDLSGRYILANQGTCLAIGKPEAEIIGKNDNELFPAESAAVINAADAMVMASGTSTVAEERLVTTFGDTYWLAGKSPLRDYGGAVIGIIGISRNITDRKKAEEERRELAARLRQAEKMEAIGTLAGGIAHDFNNILGVILGYAEMAKDDAKASSPLARDLHKVVTAAYRAKDLVSQILAFSRQQSIESIPFQPASIVKEAVKLLRAAIPTTIDVLTNVDPASSTVFADPTQVNQILMNLGINAFHAMEQRGGTLSVSLQDKELKACDLIDHPGQLPGRFVELSVKDTGIGIDPLVRPRIFDPYFTTKAFGKGTGMGLAIIHGIVKSSGGFITVDSTVGVGTEFKVYFPAVDTAALPEESAPEADQEGKERILFVDDEELLVTMGRDMLTKLGYQVTTCTSAIEAVAIFTNQPEQFDLLITDQTMPGMTGFDLARRVLQIRPGMPIILCTGYSTLVSPEQAKEAGIKEFALKPLLKREIAKLIRKALDSDAEA